MDNYSACGCFVILKCMMWYQTKGILEYIKQSFGVYISHESWTPNSMHWMKRDSMWEIDKLVNLLIQEIKIYALPSLYRKPTTYIVYAPTTIFNPKQRSQSMHITRWTLEWSLDCVSIGVLVLIKQKLYKLRVYVYTLLMGPLMNVVFVWWFDVLITLQLYIYSSIALHKNSLYST